MKRHITRFVSIMLVSVLSLSLLNPASANELESLSNEDTPLYSYEYKGIEFTGDTELSQDELEIMYNDIINPSSNSNGEITTFAEDHGSSMVRVVPPYYRTYKNTGYRAAAELTTLYLISKTPKKLKRTTLGIWIIGKFQGWTNAIKPTYVGSWISSSWSNYQNKRVYHATLVHFKKSNYTSPTSVQYWDVSQWY